MKLKRLTLYIFSIPKTIYFNFKYFNFKNAIRFPILVSKNVLLSETSGRLTINGELSTGMIRIGFGDVSIFDQSRSKSIWSVSGNIVFNGKAFIGHGSKIDVSGDLILGKNFKISAESTLICKKNIIFGDNCLISWDDLIMDTDFHKIYNENKKILNSDKGIQIGNNVWVGCRCTILKGTIIKDNTVIASNCTLSSKLSVQNTIIGGNPIRILKENITWNE